MMFSKTVLISVISLVTTTSFATLSKACYTATNPQVIRASSEEGKDKWKVKSANVVLETAKDQYATSGEHTDARMALRTVGGPVIEIWSIMDPQLRTTLPTYSVECDGGRMTVVKMKNGTVIANSERIRGEYKTAEGEGCNNANVSFKNLAFKQVTCK